MLVQPISDLQSFACAVVHDARRMMCQCHSNTESRTATFVLALTAEHPVVFDSGFCIRSTHYHAVFVTLCHVLLRFYVPILLICSSVYGIFNSHHKHLLRFQSEWGELSIQSSLTPAKAVESKAWTATNHRKKWDIPTRNGGRDQTCIPGLLVVALRSDRKSKLVTCQQTITCESSCEPVTSLPAEAQGLGADQHCICCSGSA